MTATLIETCLLALTAGTVLALFSLLAIWAAVGRRPHWFIRIAFLLVAIALLLPIEAHDVALFFLYQSALIITALLAVNVGWPLLRRILGRSTDEPAKFQLTLKDLFLITTVVSAAVAIATAAAGFSALPASVSSTAMSIFWTGEAGSPTVDWSQFNRPVMLTTLVALSAVLAIGATGNRRRRVACSLIFVATTALACWDASGDGLDALDLTPNPFFGSTPIKAWAVVVHAGLTILVLALWRIGHFASTRGRSGQADSRIEQRSLFRRASRYAQPALIVMGLLSACPLGYLYWRLAVLPAIPSQRPAELDGINELMAIAKQFENITIPSEEDGDVGLAAFAAKHAAIVDDVHRALARPSFIPVNYTQNGRMFDRGDVPDLVYAMEAIGRDAELRGQTQQAMNVSLDIIRIGHMVARDRRLSHDLMGAIFGKIGSESLRPLRHALTIQQQHELIRKLDRFENAIGSFDGFVKRYKIWSMHALGWRDRLLLIVRELSGTELELLDSTRRDRDFAFLERRLLTTTMAINLYRQDQADLPESLGQLVPKYLPRVYDDPFGSGPFVYRRQDEQRFVLYSLGENRIDDGGTVGYSDEVGIVFVEDASEKPKLDHLYLDPEEGDYFLDLGDWRKDIYEEEDWEKDEIDEEDGEESEDSP